MGAKTILDDEGYEPCRDERCSIEEIHPKHKRELPTCPRCAGVLIKMPDQQARCSSCSWRGDKKDLQAYA